MKIITLRIKLMMSVLIKMHTFPAIYIAFCEQIIKQQLRKLPSSVYNLKARKVIIREPRWPPYFLSIANGRANVLEPVSLRFIHLTLSLGSTSHF